LFKLKRKKKTTKKDALSTKWRRGIWMGVTTRSNEHIVIIDGGEEAVRVRTIKRRPIDERWSAEGVEAIKATPRHPTVKKVQREDVKSDDKSRPIDIGGDGVHL
jgi:hypothetical protein